MLGPCPGAGLYDFPMDTLVNLMVVSIKKKYIVYGLNISLIVVNWEEILFFISIPCISFPLLRPVKLLRHCASEEEQIYISTLGVISSSVQVGAKVNSCPYHLKFQAGYQLGEQRDDAGAEPKCG